MFSVKFLEYPLFSLTAYKNVMQNVLAAKIVMFAYNSDNYFFNQWLTFMGDFNSLDG